MKYLLVFLLSTTLYARTTYEQIKKNSPNLPIVYAKALANTIDYYSDTYRVPANVVAAIFMVESSYRIGAINKRSNDFGLGQVNAWHIRRSKLNKHLLLTDINYSTEQAVKIFKWFYETYPLDRAIMGYNGGTSPKIVNWKSVKRYLRLVKGYM